MIRQIGAFPYRINADGAAEVMLITSRDTGRWVVPKGNPIVGLSPHEAAATEAWEEAGLTGYVCAAPLGEYRYLKRRRRGEEEAVVALYPLAVADQAADWPEKAQRETRWFALTAAAASVTEPQLKVLIAGFRIPAAPVTLAERVFPAVQGDVVRRNAAGKKGRQFRMLGWFQSLMPKQGRFFEQFEAHAATLVAGADALAKLFHGEGPVETQIAAIVHHEHQADDITRDVLQDVRRVFVTPFDRSAISDLIGVMDDAIDQMNQTAGSIALYEVTSFEAGMRDMAGIVVEAARITAEAIPLLRSINNNGDRLAELTGRMIEIEGHADGIHDRGLKALYQAHQAEPMRFIVGREIYGHLERIVDRFEDVANEIQGLVIDHA
jgi:predicted phosphate transport protein (TIGR00153 family)